MSQTAGHLPTADRTLVKNLVSAKARFEGLTAQALGPDAECLSEEEMEAMLQVRVMGCVCAYVRRIFLICFTLFYK